MSNKNKNTKKATTTSEQDAVVATASTTEVTAVIEPVATVTEPVAEVTAPVAEVTAPVAEETASVAEVTAPVAAKTKDSLKIGKGKQLPEFLKFTHPDGRVLQFKIASKGLFSIQGRTYTPETLCKEGNEQALLDFANNHPRYFTEVFE
jgi:hypothetical protein